MKPSRFVGIDLTGSDARTPRAVDVAILDAQTGRVVFDQFPWPPEGPAEHPWPTIGARALSRQSNTNLVRLSAEQGGNLAAPIVKACIPSKDAESIKSPLTGRSNQPA
jgi:hypothetical protein